jgi:hypothetical protein
LTFARAEDRAMTTRLLIGCVLVSSTVAIAAKQPPNLESWDQGKFSAEGLVGYGVGFDSPNAYGFGFGGRIGYTFPGAAFPKRVFTGVSYLYHTGTSQTLPVVGSGTVKVWTLMGEVGTEIIGGPIEVRPFLGLGVGSFSGIANTTVYFGIISGGVASYSFNGPLSRGPFLGADIHWTWLPAAGASIANDISFLGLLGYRL